MSLSREFHQSEAVFLVPLGGLGEIGMNMMALVHRSKAVIIDCGVTFPDSYFPGVDLVMPKIDFFREFKLKIEGLVLTHSHEDHLGAVGYLHRQLGTPPIYGTAFTLSMLRPRYKEYNSLDEKLLHTIAPRKNFRIADFEFEPLRVTHSLVDCIGLGIDTPAGKIVHTGDFKIDRHPIDGWEFDEGRYRELGKEGVRLFMSDSTNVESPGWCLSEHELKQSLLEEIQKIKSGKVIVTLFSSNIHRIQILLEIAEACGRKVALLGRSVLSNSELAFQSGHLKCPPSLLVSASEADRMEPRDVMVLCTGTQAEGRAALSKMTSGSHPDIDLRPGDTVIFSSRHIPGNEKRISALINNICRVGANIVDFRQGLVHVSGHAKRDELAEILQWVKPEVFLPVHGEYRMLVKHLELARELNPKVLGMVAENGDVLKLTRDSYVRLTERVPSGKIFLDETRNTIREDVIRVRRKISNSGVVTVGAVFKRKRFELIRGPDVLTLGTPTDFDILELEGMLHDLFDDFRNANQVEVESLEEEIRVVTRRFFRKALGVKPRVIPIVYVT